MTQFKGIKQVTLTFYNGMTDEEKSGYLFLVRDGEYNGDGSIGNPTSEEIYFGKRKYGDTSHRFVTSVVETFGGLLDSGGGFIFPVGEDDFLTVDETKVDNLYQLLKALDTAINDNKVALKSVYTKTEVDNLLKAFEGCLKGVSVKVGENSTINGSVDENGVATIDLSKAFAAAGKVQDVQVGGNSVVTEGIANIVIPEYTIAKADTPNENAAATYYLTKNGIKIGVDINIPLDQVLKSSSIETVETENTPYDGAVVGDKYIKFEFQNNDVPQYLPVKDLVDVYTSGTAIEVSETNQISVKVASENNFLSVNESNELIVDDITTDKTMLKEDITIEGGPLASDAVKKAFTNGVIPAGTDIQAVLKALLCVEIYPVPTNNTPTYSVSISAPTVTANVKKDTLVEVGQTISFNSVTAKSVTVSKTNPKVSGLTHGYSDTIDGEKNSGTTISTEWTVSQMANQVYELSASIVSGFTGTLPTTVQNAAAGSCVLSSCSLVASEGTNTYKVTEDAPKHTGSHSGIDSYYIVSNLGGRSEEKKTTAINSEENVEKDPSNQSTSFTVTGVYPIFTNGVTASTTDATAAAMEDLASPVSGEGTKLDLMKSGTSFAVSFANQGLEPYRLFLPGSWKVSTAMAINPTTAKFAIDCKSKFVANGTVTRIIQGKEVTYTVYEWASTEGPNRVKFTVA